MAPCFSDKRSHVLRTCRPQPVRFMRETFYHYSIHFTIFFRPKTGFHVRICASVNPYDVRSFPSGPCHFIEFQAFSGALADVPECPKYGAARFQTLLYRTDEQNNTGRTGGSEGAVLPVSDAFGYNFTCWRPAWITLFGRDHRCPYSGLLQKQQLPRCAPEHSEAVRHIPTVQSGVFRDQSRTRKGGTLSHPYRPGYLQKQVSSWELITPTACK